MSADPTGATALTGPIWLASRSPRRRRMLGEAGVSVRVHPSGIDERRLRPGRVPPAAWAVALAYIKARWVARDLDADGAAQTGTIIAADTICVEGGDVLGQPVDAAAARTMLRRLRGVTHATITGVCLLARAGGARWLFADRATVRLPDLDDAEIDRYVESGEWRGKAGAYNLDDRRRAGWDIACDGDPATVMGLPLRRLRPWLAVLAEPAA